MPTPTYFLGLRDSNDFGTDVRPKSFREGILYLDWAGMAPITALTNMMQSEALDDPEHSWWEEGPITHTVDGTAGAFVYEDTGLSDVADNGEAASTTLYIKMTAANAKMFVSGDTGAFIDQSALDNTVYWKATADPVINGASSYVTVKTLNADSGSIFAGVDRVVIFGSAYAEGADRPTAKATDPTKRTQYLQIFRQSLKITGTALEMKTRTMQNKLAQKRQNAQRHLYQGLEMAFLMGYGSEDTAAGANGTEPQRTTWGIIPWLETNQSTHVLNFATSYAGNNWLAKGDEFLASGWDLLTSYSTGSLVMLCGNKALNGIDKLAKAGMDIRVEPGGTKYGLKTRMLVTPQLDIELVQHPIMSRNDTYQSFGIVMDPKNLKYLHMNNRDFKIIENDRLRTEDFISEEYRGECGIEIRHSEQFLVFKNLGNDA